MSAMAKVRESQAESWCAVVSMRHELFFELQCVACDLADMIVKFFAWHS